MYFALVYYPRLNHPEFHSFRNKYEPYADLLPEHIPFIFPVPDSVGEKKLETHIKEILAGWNPIEIHITGLTTSWDHWLLLVLKEGNDLAIQLHDELYTGILSPFLREDLPYIPHIGLGLFSKEAYDFHNPAERLTLDEEKLQKAKSELEGLNLDFRRTIDRLTLLKVNEDFTRCRDIKEFRLK
jgi:hypothetical protein